MTRLCNQTVDVKTRVLLGLITFITRTVYVFVDKTERTKGNHLSSFDFDVKGLKERNSENFEVTKKKT